MPMNPPQIMKLSKYHATSIIPKTIPPVAMPLVLPFFLATEPRIVAIQPKIAGKKKRPTRPQTRAAIAIP